MRVPSVPLRISGGENGVDKNKGTNDLSTQSGTFVVAIANSVNSTSVPVVVRFLEPFGQPSTADCTGALCYHVQQRPHQRHLASQEQPECHRRVDVSPCKLLNIHNFININFVFHLCVCVYIYIMFGVRFVRKTIIMVNAPEIPAVQ